MNGLAASRGMNRRRFLKLSLAVVGLALLAGGIAIWFATIPQYAWLIFGPQHRLRVLIADRPLWITVTQFVDGQETSSQRYRNWESLGDLTFHDPDGRTTYTLRRPGRATVDRNPVRTLATVDIGGPIAYRQYCDLTFAPGNPQSAPVAHFHGPLTVGAVTINWKLPTDLVLRRGSEPTTLRSFVGTMDAAHGCWVVVNSHDGDRPRFPDSVRPEVEIAFPARDVTVPPIVERFVLDQVCCGCVFYAPVKVPDAAGEGKAKVTFSFPAWSGGRVASSTIELRIAAAAPAANVATAQPAAH
jgi:hypothetical protein